MIRRCALLDRLEEPTGPFDHPGGGQRLIEPEVSVNPARAGGFH